MVLLRDFKDLNNQIFEGSNSIKNDFVTRTITTMIKSIIGKNLHILEFVYHCMNQLSAILSSKLKLTDECDITNINQDIYIFMLNLFWKLIK